MRVLTTAGTWIEIPPDGVEITTGTMTGCSERERYEEDLRRRQQEHLESIRGQRDFGWQPCMHDQCPECVGTGIRRDGGICIHNISCPCPKCTPRC